VSAWIRGCSGDRVAIAIERKVNASLIFETLTLFDQSRKR
jgi:hypothetical protein